MTFTLLAVAGWTIAALAFTAGWATHARLSFRPRTRRRILSAAAPRRTRRAHPRTIQPRRRTLAARPSLRLPRPSDVLHERPVLRR